MNIGNFEGFIDCVSHAHVMGWIFNRGRPSEKVQHEVVLDDTGEVLLRARADTMLPGLRELGVGDGAHGFYHRLPRRLTNAEQARLRVRTVTNAQNLPRSPTVSTVYQPLAFLIMDIVDNCNLRCPFCLYDYRGVNKTNFMTSATMEAVLRYAPYTSDGSFWYSCLHEPTLHPKFIDFLRKMPPRERRTIFFTSNFARRMPDEYYQFLANSGIHHINLSIESLDPAIYEAMRKGARHPIFKESWDKLLQAFSVGKAPPKLRYIAMAYKSNFRELPGLVEYLLNERGGAEVEIRYTYDEPHIPTDFRTREYLEPAEWLWLRDQLAQRLSPGVTLHMPPGIEEGAVQSMGGIARDGDLATSNTFAPPPPSAQLGGFSPGRYGFQMKWDGSLDISRFWDGPGQPDRSETLLRTLNIRDAPDPDALLSSLPI